MDKYMVVKVLNREMCIPYAPKRRRKVQTYNTALSVGSCATLRSCFGG